MTRKYVEEEVKEHSLDIILPKKIYALLGDNENSEQLNLYFHNIIQGRRGDMLIDISSPYGRHYNDFWRLEPGNSTARFHDVSEGSFELVVKVKDHNLNTLKECSTTVEIVPKAAEECCRILCLGDSMTRAAVYVKHLQQTLPNIKTLGTRTYDEGKTCTEGRGGWSAKNYFGENLPKGNQSPFLFPQGVDGNRYIGNVEFWKNVLYTSPEEYDFKGFQKIARGWSEDTGLCLFDENGYPVQPKPGEVVFDPSFDKTGKFMEWNGQGWEAVNPQPEWEFSFSKYMERFGAAFEEDGHRYDPDIVTVLLGANGHKACDMTDAIAEEFIEDTRRMIASIKEYNSNIMVVVNLPILGAGQDAWGLCEGCAAIGARYDRNMQMLGRRILNEWDNENAAEQGIHVSPMSMNIDPIYGYDTISEAANKYTDVQVARHSDWVHPNPAGYKQMGDVLSGVIQKIRNKK